MLRSPARRIAPGILPSWHDQMRHYRFASHGPILSRISLVMVPGKLVSTSGRGFICKTLSCMVIALIASNLPRWAQ
ncbi:MAG TPA: hypothetical protein VFF81_09850 [Noviherbaspirillum sp.]|nr:hypothetical protein [Noviherbaspirillum sp.]